MAALGLHPADPGADPEGQIQRTYTADTCFSGSALHSWLSASFTAAANAAALNALSVLATDALANELVAAAPATAGVIAGGAVGNDVGPDGGM
eukprot:gene15674-6278_t